MRSTGTRLLTIAIVVMTAAVAAQTSAAAVGRCSGARCTTNQQLRVQVTPGQLSQSVASPGAHSASVTVTDTRGASTGWSLVAYVTHFSDGRRSAADDRLRVSPHCRAVAPGSAPGVAAGPADQPARSGILLCAKNDARGASGSTGGIYQVGADLTLDRGAGRGPGGYTATITLLLA